MGVNQFVMKNFCIIITHLFSKYLLHTHYMYYVVLDHVDKNIYIVYLYQKNYQFTKQSKTQP